MRYLIHNSQKKELPARAIYLYDAFHLYLLPRFSEGEFTVLTPIGHVDMDILFITGHTNFVEAYLRNYINKIPEKRLSLLAAWVISLKGFPKRKLYMSPQEQIYSAKSDSEKCMVMTLTFLMQNSIF